MKIIIIQKCKVRYKFHSVFVFLFNEKFPTVTVCPVAPAYPLAALEKMLNYLTFRCCGDELSDETCRKQLFEFAPGNRMVCLV